MIISTSRIETQIILETDRASVLHIENPREYYLAVSQLLAAFRGEESEFSFWENGERIRPDKKGDMLTDIFSFELTDKKIVSLLYKQLQQEYFKSDLLLKFGQLNSYVQDFLTELCQREDFALEFDDLTLENILKVCAVKPTKNYDSLLEKVVSYLNILVQLKGIEFFIFVGLKRVMSNEDLELLYNHCRLHKISLLLIEGEKIGRLSKEEKAIIITEDLCELLENYSDLC